MELLASSRVGRTLPEIERELQLPKSSVHCLLITLERHRYLRRNESTGRYVFGSRLFSLGNLSLSGIDVRQAVLPHMRSLMDRTGLTVHLAVLEGFEAFRLVEAVEEQIEFARRTGRRLQISHFQAVGETNWGGSRQLWRGSSALMMTGSTSDSIATLTSPEAPS